MTDEVNVESTAAVAEPESVSTDPHPAGFPDAQVVPEAGGILEPSAGGVARLVVKRSGAETDVEYVISPPAIIGRFDPSVGPIDVDLAGLPEGAYVSRKHAKITQDDGVWKLHDLGSSNGTFVLRADFERVDEADLLDGMEFALGNARFVFHYS